MIFKNIVPIEFQMAGSKTSVHHSLKPTEQKVPSAKKHVKNGIRNGGLISDA